MLLHEVKMQELIEKILNEWSSQIPSGIIDLQNENHKLLLLKILNETVGNDDAVGQIIENIFRNK